MPGKTPPVPQKHWLTPQDRDGIRNRLPQNRSPQRKRQTQRICSSVSVSPYITPVVKMQFSTVVEKLNGEVVGAELACSVREENTSQRESYSADWNSICLKTRPQEG